MLYSLITNSSTVLIALGLKNFCPCPLDSHFIFNGRLYPQVDSVAMGSPLGPLFANIFMSFKPLLYRHYVDNCFLLFRSLDHMPLFLDYLNRQHANITFTTEIERDGKLPFLDIDISRSESKFATSVDRRPTFTGLFTKFQSFIPNTYKQNLVSCLIHRIFIFCSSYENFHTQLKVVRKLFNLNGFPSHMFDRIVRRLLDHTFDPKPPVLTAPKKIIYCYLPFIVIHSLQIRADIRFIFRSSRRISSFFPFKDKVPKYLRPSVVYLFKCRCCSASYVDQTTRHLHTRISERLGIFPITGKHSTSPAISGILSHTNSGHLWAPS